MKRSKLLIFVIFALLLATALAILPAFQDAKAVSSAPTKSSSHPGEGASGVLAGPGTDFSVSFDQATEMSGFIPYIYWYDPTKSSWTQSSAPCTNVSRSPDGYTISFSLPDSMPDGLETDTVYGIMLPGPDNTRGDNTGYVANIYGDRYTGIDFPSSYALLSTATANCWTFRTAGSYDAPSVLSMSPAAGSTAVDPDTEIHLYFDQPVASNTGNDYFIEIRDYNTDEAKKQIKNTDVLATGTTADITIPGQSLASGTEYYIYIDSNAFIGGWSGFNYPGLSDKSLYFTTGYTLKYNAGTGGSITGITTQTLAQGQDGTEVIAVPDTASGYHFVQWSDGILTANRTDLAVSGDITVEAQFALDQFTLSYDTDGQGTISGEATQTVNFGSSGAVVTATPNTGYYFTGWSDGNSNPARQETGVTEDKYYTAYFEPYQYNLVYTAGANGTISGTANQQVYYGESGAPVEAVPDPTYHFVRWSDGSTSAIRTDTNVSGNISVTAEFSNTFTLDYLSGGNGFIAGTTSQTVTYGGSGTLVTATPAYGYHFVQWSDGNTNPARQDTNITENKSLTAEFAANFYSLKYAAGEHGTVTGTLEQEVEYGSSGTQVIAVPNAHYHFSKWSDGVVTSYRTETNVTVNIDVTAVFAINKYKVTFEDYDGTVLKTQYVAYGSDATPPEDPERVGYTFSEWYGDYDNITSSEVVTAEYVINKYKVTFMDYDGTVLKTQDVSYGVSASAPVDPEREGYTFTGWDGDFTKITAALTLKALYKANTFKVTFVDYNGSELKLQDVEPGVGAAAPEDPVRNGYIFTGWDLDFSAVNEDMTVTAQYSLGLVVTKAVMKNGKPAITVVSGDLEIAEASVEGGKAIVNQDGTITLEFPNGVKAGDVKVTLKLANGKTVTETVKLTDEVLAPVVSTGGAATPPLWIWIAVGALVVASVTLISIFTIRHRRLARR